MASRGAIVGIASAVTALAIGLFASTASADGGGGDEGNGADDENTGGGDEEKEDDQGGGTVDTGDVDLETNWGAVPMDWRIKFAAAEVASGIPGAGRYMAIWAWGAWRAGQAPVGPDVVAQLVTDPNWCRLCHNTSASERAASKSALDRVTKSKAQGGAYDKPWAMPADYAGWTDGSYGLLDLLAGAQCHAGIHDGYAPLVTKPATVLYTWRAQFYVGGWFIFRCIHRADLPVLAPQAGTTWGNIRACSATPVGFIAWKKGQAGAGAMAAAKAFDNFQIRAAELGIDPDQIANPNPATWKWPGAKAYWQALAPFDQDGADLGQQGGGGGMPNLPAGLTQEEKAAVEKVAAERPTSTPLAQPPHSTRKPDQTEENWLTNVAFFDVYVPLGAPAGPLPANSPFAPAWSRMRQYLGTLTLGQQAVAPGNQFPTDVAA